MNKRSEDNKQDQETIKAEEKKYEEKPESKEWTDDEIKLLVKGCKLIAVGTRNRYEIIK